MTATPKNLGKYGEACAAAELEKYGYKIIGRNWRCDVGEIDIVALHENDLVAVEVKTRRGRGAADRAAASFDSAKQSKLVQLAEIYHTALERDDLGVRVDFVSVEVTPDGDFVEIYRDALNW